MECADLYTLCSPCIAPYLITTLCLAPDLRLPHFCAWEGVSLLWEFWRTWRIGEALEQFTPIYWRKRLPAQTPCYYNF